MAVAIGNMSKTVRVSRANVDANSADRALLLGLNPLAEALVVEDVAADVEAEAVEEGLHADDTDPVDGGGGAGDDGVDGCGEGEGLLVLGDGGDHFDGGVVEGGEGRNHPEAVEEVDFVVDHEEAQEGQVGEVPDARRRTHDLVVQLQLQQRRLPVDVLVKKVHQILPGLLAQGQQEHAVYAQQHAGKAEETQHFHSHAEEADMSPQDSNHAEEQEGDGDELGARDEAYDVGVVREVTQQERPLNVEDVHDLAKHADAGVGEEPAGQVEHIPVEVGQDQDDDAQVVEVGVLEGVGGVLLAPHGHAEHLLEEEAEEDVEGEEGDGEAHHALGGHQGQLHLRSGGCKLYSPHRH